MTRNQVVVVGAGMSGLTAARALKERGVDAMVIDKGRAVGGRMATRRRDGATFDHGAQHFSARSDEFRAAVARWMEAGIVKEWYRSQSVTEPKRGVEPRHSVAGGMRRLPEHLAAGLDVRCGVRVGRLRHIDDGIQLLDASEGVVAEGVAILVTAPIPQTLQLLDESEIVLRPEQAAQLASVRYDSTLAVMAVPKEPPSMSDGHLTPSDGVVAWIADNQHKGASVSPSITVHSTARFAQAYLEQDPDAWVAPLVAAAQEHLGTELEALQGHRWRHSQPRSTLDIGAMSLGPEIKLVLAGEAFMGAKVEGAFRSGLAAAGNVLSLLGLGD